MSPSALQSHTVFEDFCPIEQRERFNWRALQCRQLLQLPPSLEAALELCLPVCAAIPNITSSFYFIWLLLLLPLPPLCYCSSLLLLYKDVPRLRSECQRRVRERTITGQNGGASCCVAPSSSSSLFTRCSLFPLCLSVRL